MSSKRCYAPTFAREYIGNKTGFDRNAHAFLFLLATNHDYWVYGKMNRLNSPFFRACKNPWSDIFEDRWINKRTSPSRNEIWSTIYILCRVILDIDIRDTRYGANTSHIPSVRSLLAHHESRLKERIKRKEKVVKDSVALKDLYILTARLCYFYYKTYYYFYYKML